jgi:hypothetical protein
VPCGAKLEVHTVSDGSKEDRGGVLGWRWGDGMRVVFGAGNMRGERVESEMRWVNYSVIG